MYKFLNQIHKSFFLMRWENNDYFLEDGFLIKKKKDKVLWKSNTKAGNYFIYNKNCLISGTESLRYFDINIGNLIFEETQLKPFNSGCFIDLIVDNLEISNRRLSKYDLLNHKIIWTTEFKRGAEFYISPHSFISTLFRKKQQLYSISNKNGKKVWDIDIRDIDSINTRNTFERIIGYFQNQLYIACNNNLIISIDINSGKLIDRFKELSGFKAGQYHKDVIPEPTNFVLDNQNNKLIGVFHTSYIEIDMVSSKVHYENLVDELNSHNINSFRRIGNNPFTENHFFLTGHADEKDQPVIDFDCVLALNRQTKKIDWKYTFKDTGLGTNTPQITDTHLYQLDLENTLHIFKKEIL